MKVSVIIPCYNVEPYIEKCVDSLSGKATKEWEFILINDGSADNTLEALDRIKEKYATVTNIEIIDQKNKGVSEARNIGLAKARGIYIVFIDGDDWTEDNFIPFVISKMEEGYDFVLTPFFRAYNDNFTPKNIDFQGEFSSAEIKRRMLGPIGKEIIDPSKLEILSGVAGKGFRTEIIRQNNLSFIDFNTTDGEDLIFNLQYMQNAKKIFADNTPMYFYRRDNAGSLTSSYKSDHFERLNRKFKYIRETVKLGSDTDETALKNRIAMGLISLSLNEMNNQNGRKDVLKNMRTFLKDPLYKDALSQFDIQYFPIHWKLFFKAAKNGWTYPVYLLTKAMHFIIKSRR